MNIRECYYKIGGDYESVLKRLGSEDFIKRIVQRFPKDTSYQMIMDGIATGDAELAFRGAHTLKGVCANLDFARLYESSSRLTEILRDKQLENYEEVLDLVTLHYQATLEAISELD